MTDKVASGLTYIKDVGIELILAELKTISVPTISGSAGTPVGHVDYTLSNIAITNLALPDSILQLKPGTGIQVGVSSAVCDVSLNWHYREHSWPHISDHGSASVDVSKTTISVTVAIGEASGRPTVAVDASEVDIGSFHIKVHGGASWLYNWLVGLFKGSVKSSVQSSLKSAIVDAINKQAEEALATLPIKEKVDKYSSVNYAMLAPPSITATQFSSVHLGQFLSNSPAPPGPWAPVKLPTTVDAADEINLVFSEDVAFSAGYVYFKAGALHTTVNELPSWSPVSLNTTSMRFLLPALYKAYPDMKVEFELAANATPNAAISPDGATCDVLGNVAVYVLPAGQPRIYAFTLGLHLFGTGKVAVSANNITAQVSYVGCNLSLANTTAPIGNFNVQLLDALVNLAVSKGLVPWINKVLGVGFPIPVVSGITLSSIEVVYGTGYVGLASDFTYAPPTLGDAGSAAAAAYNAAMAARPGDAGDLIKASLPVRIDE
ncbi:bactericidal permeability-increasing protein [Thecamonas trahens ATCC 50062]|uniref:Bactericidal permeability-increasing protein n=1 Tax=Thecamonas trahens ATCC 50062 TaxID=461836 RepID=A0A0L0DRR4_THETB|nr:bactericidal permeability-increasing protein [Thecamonas trahens ATCC 50062]KNC54113.1 bactericidal permeability-increasing protein [Thecamonas trahens ATCC 50062]|eukprot:XP_013753936.1 bactericidal permeability-increasing protein [Thecamonas trahens ATCC 50062]